MSHFLFVSCPKGLEYLLEDELKALGLMVERVNPQGVYGQADLATLYEICLCSRLANRVQLILFSGFVKKEADIYKICHDFNWQKLFVVEKSLAIEFHGTSPEIRNSMYGAQVVKDAIVDYFRAFSDARPTIDRENPDIFLHAHLKHQTLTVSYDLLGYSLHQRGYRLQQGAAPLKENIATAMLTRAKWLELVSQGYALHDPFCGSGTLVIEAAMMAANIAPGLLRDDQAFQHWLNHNPSLWQKTRMNAQQRIKSLNIKLLGSDSCDASINMARANAKRAGVDQWVEFKVCDVKECKAPAQKGLLIANPPYGERLSDATDLLPLYEQLGLVLSTHYPAWHAAFITSSPILAKATKLRSTKQYRLYNGALECKLYWVPLVERRLKPNSSVVLSANAQMFANRVQKNYAHLSKWARRKSISCYRLYDADLPEYAFAIDLYSDHVVLQEYKAPMSISPQKAAERVQEVLQVVPLVLNLPAKNIVLKQRSPQKGAEQYQKLSKTEHRLKVQEGRAVFNVNLYDYLDTGLFLDHRLLRLKFAELAKGTRFLNCFCYTATASVHAALSGAVTTNIDLSSTYLSWAQDNFRLNHLNASEHQFIQFDCLQWLCKTQENFDVIFLDPPSFSNSKRMTATLDVQRDHEELINQGMRLLAPEGVLYFSTNLKRFKLAAKMSECYQVKEITEKTIDLDFKRTMRIHQCFMIRKKQL